MRDQLSPGSAQRVTRDRRTAAGESARVHPANAARRVKIPERFEAWRVVPRPVMPIARPKRAPAQISVAPVAEPLPITIIIPVAIAAVVTASPSEENYVMRLPSPGDRRADIDDIDNRRPTPTLAHVSPPTV